MKKIAALALAVLLTFAPSAEADTINVPGDYATIQDAVNAAVPGDIVMVAPGVYYETVALKEGVNLVGSGFENTIIDGQGVGDASGSIVRMADNSSITGFTVRNANLEPTENVGACIDEETFANTSFTVRENRLTNCRIGVVVFGSSTIERNVIVDNPVLAAIFVSGVAAPLIRNNTLVGNQRGLSIHLDATPSIVNNIVANNFAGILKTSDPDADIRFNDIYGNDVNYSGLDDLTGTAGNISADPLFVDPAQGDYTLQADSPCIDAGDPTSPLDPDGTVADMGAFYHAQAVPPSEATENLIEQIDELVLKGDLPAGNGNALSSKLEAAIKKIEQGMVKTAVNQLGAFINHVNSLIEEGVILEADGEALIDAAQAIISELEAEVLAKKSARPHGKDLLDVSLTEVPGAFVLRQNYPNPFNPVTEIEFQLPEATRVRLAIYDVVGREVARLADGMRSSGVHRVRWNAQNVPSGLYFYRITAGAFEETRRMIVLK